MKRVLCILLCFCLLLSLCGCGRRDIGPEGTYEPLPVAKTNYTAPDGDEDTAREMNHMLYLPSRDGLHLLGRMVRLQCTSSGGNEAESLIRALLEAEGDGTTRALGGETRLQLFGSHPVEVSNGICTVNLSSSALQLDNNDIYTVGLAMASTLCELSDIQYVNLLVADHAVGMDIMGNLPMGSLNARPGEDLTVLWDQMDARKTPLGRDPAQTLFSGVASLFFPVEGSTGIMPETRNISFPGQSPQIMALTLLDALSAGSQYLQGVPQMPDLHSLLTHDPLVSELDDGGRLITLSFAANMEGVLRGMNIEMSSMVAAVVYTLTTYIPGITAISIRVGDTLLTSIYSRDQGSILFPGGIQKRTQFDQFLVSRGTVYLTTGTRLKPVRRNLVRGTEHQPRVLLETLIGGATESEKAQGIRDVMPANLSGEDILGISLESNTILVNLSDHFAQQIALAGKDAEQLIAYSMVDTLCMSTGARYVCFFFEGQQVESIAGLVCWSGTFLYNPGMIEENAG